MGDETLGPGTALLTLSRGQLLLSHTDTSRGKPAVPHSLEGSAETINPSVNTTNGLERSTMRQQRRRGAGWRGWALDKTSTAVEK